MIAILLGPPGVGKGTQAAQLAEKESSWKHLSTGDLLREEVANGTDLGKQADAFMSKGDLVPDELMVAMVASRIAGLGQGDLLFLDGFPRTQAQAEALEKAAPGGSIGMALYFSAPDSVLTDRLLGRGRKDDTREVIEHRLEVYRQTTAPLVAFYREQGILHEINADRGVPEIQAEVAGVVRSVLQTI